MHAYLARHAAAAAGRLYDLPLFLIFLTISYRPISSKSTELIFAKFSGLVELWL